MNIDDVISEWLHEADITPVVIEMGRYANHSMPVTDFIFKVHNSMWTGYITVSGKNTKIYIDHPEKIDSIIVIDVYNPTSKEIFYRVLSVPSSSA